MRLRTGARHWIRSAWWRLVGTRRVRTEIARRQSVDHVPLEAIQAWEARQAARNLTVVLRFDDSEWQEKMASVRDRLSRVRIGRG